jgi:ABC-2 type transport system ATP-binding protein/lipopolysaccharide transport system ATP-binding protein
VTDSAIEARGLGKRYRLGEQQAAYGTLRDALAGVARRDRRGRDIEHWALRDVDLTVREGEALGIVGQNGAGKSTLLKILARITEPTTGFTRTRGRVGVMLEVGTGFHPELTGRENVFLAGAVMGMTRRDVRRRFDEIVTFAGVEPFLDTPLKRYSSGMQLRLAFAVAAHLEPELMLVDEILAVGDVEFQRRCLSRMNRLSEEGRTVLFVSHDLGAVTRLCSRAIWTDRGRIIRDGDPTDIVREYYAKVLGQGGQATFEIDGEIGVTRVAIADELGGLLHQPTRGEPFAIEADIVARRPYHDLDVGIYVRDRDGTMLTHEWWSDQPELPSIATEAGHYRVTLHLPPLLRAGEYVVGLWIGNDQTEHFHREVLQLVVVPQTGDRQHWLTRRRLIQPCVRWSSRSLEGIVDDDAGDVVAVANEP